MTKTNGKIHCAHRLEELILLKCPYNPKQSRDLMQSLSNYNDIFHRTRTNNPKICLEPQKTANCQSNLEQKITKLEVSCFLTSDTTIKLQ